MTNIRFQRPIAEYDGSEALLYKDKYQLDSNSVPKIAISSAKIDGDFNYIVDAVNTLDEDIKTVVHSGISNQSIEQKHIAPNSITSESMLDGSIMTRALSDGAVTNSKLSDLAITTPKLANNSVTKDKMVSDSVGTDEIVDGSITKDKLAPDAISDSVPVGTIAQYSVTTLPTGWVLCSGATVSKNTYPELVRFLTSSDTILTVELPNMNTDVDEVVKFAIKAFSDVAELATLEIAGLTQDIVNNTADILTKADIDLQAIAGGHIKPDLTSLGLFGVKSFTKLGIGNFEVVLDDEFADINFDVLIGSYTNWANAIVNSKPVNNKFNIYINNTKGSSSGSIESDFYFRAYKRKVV